MARAASDTAPVRETEAQAAEMAALLRLLEISAGTFSLSIAVYNSPALRDYLIGRVKEFHPDLALISLPRDCVDVYGEVIGLVGDTRVPGLFVTGIEYSVSSESEEPRTLKSLNASRDLWESRFSCPVVFWVPSYIAAILPTQAPDLWRYRSHGFEFAAPVSVPVSTPGEVITADLTLAGNLDIDAKRFRIAELEQRVKSLGWPPSDALIPYAIVWMQELAFLYSRSGKLGEANATIRKALSLCTGSLWLSVKATLLVDLGNIAVHQRQVESAESLYREALEINRQIANLEGEAICLGNLGLASRKRGDLESAEHFYRAALEIDERLGRLDGQSTQLGNLGNVASARGDLENAEQHYRKALKIERHIGRLEGQAAQLGNLGLLYLSRGDHGEAERFLSEALAIHRVLGWSEGHAARLAHLGMLKVNRGDLTAGEKLLRQSLEIDRRLENIEGQAQHLTDLAEIAESRHDVNGARHYWTEARDLFVRLGHTDRVDHVQRKLDGLLPT